MMEELQKNYEKLAINLQNLCEKNPNLNNLLVSKIQIINSEISNINDLINEVNLQILADQIDLSEQDKIYLQEMTEMQETIKIFIPYILSYRLYQMQIKSKN